MIAVQTDEEGKYIRFCTSTDVADVLENEEGYIVSVPFPNGFKKYVTRDKAFKFDIEAYLNLKDSDEQQDYTVLWQEGLTQDEIDELIRTKPNETELLQMENAMLAVELVETQIRLDNSEAEQANLLLELVDKGVL